MKKRKARIMSAVMIAAMSVSAASVSMPVYAAASTSEGRTVSRTFSYIHGSTDTDKESMTSSTEKVIYSNHGKVNVSYDAETSTFSMNPVADDGYLFVGYAIMDAGRTMYNENYIKSLMTSNFNGKAITVNAKFEKKASDDAENKTGYINFRTKYFLDEAPNMYNVMSSIFYDQTSDTVKIGAVGHLTQIDSSIAYGVKTYDLDTGEQISLEEAEKNTKSHRISAEAYAYIPVKKNFDSFMASVVRDPADYGVVSAEASGSDAYKVRFDHGWITIKWKGETEADPDTVTETSDKYFSLEAEPDGGYEQTGTLALIGTKGADLIITEKPFFAGSNHIFNKIKFTKKAEPEKTTDTSSGTATSENLGKTASSSGMTSKSETTTSKAGTTSKTGTAPANSKTVSAKINIAKSKYTIRGPKNVKYTGRKVYPKVSLYISGKKVTATLKTSGNATSIGSNKKMKITGTGKYTGTVTVSYSIIPADIKISLKTSNNKIKAAVTGLKGGAKSQIQYRTVTTVKKKKKYSSWKTLTPKIKFKSGQKVQVRARATKNKLSGSWTAARSATIPKKTVKKK